MNFLGYNITRKKSATFTNIKDSNNALFWFLGGSSANKTMQTITVQGQANAYTYCEPVATIINRLAHGLTNAVWKVKNEKGEKPLNYDTKGYKKLFTQPNPFQNFNEFMIMAEVCRRVFGVCYILPIRPAGMSDRYANYYVLPNTWLNITYNTSKSMLFMSNISERYSSITLSVNGFTQNINPSDLIIVTDSHVNLIDCDNLSISKLVTLKDQISNVTAAYESRGVLIKNRGANGIISPKGGNTMQILSNLDKENIEQRIQTSYGNMADQLRYIVSSSGVDFTKLEMSVGDLKLFEEIVEDTISIAEAYDYPPQLLGISKNSTYNNVSEARKALYENAIMPAAYTWAYTFENYFMRDPSNTNTIEPDFSDMEIFQKSQKEKAEEFEITRATYTQMFKDGIIKQNELFVALGQQPRKDGDKYINQIDDIAPAEKLGVGGLQSLKDILADPNITPIQKTNILKIIFKFSDEDSKLLASK